MNTDSVVIALDVGGTGIKCALVRPDGSVQHTERHPTDRERGTDAVVETILHLAEGLAKTAGHIRLIPQAIGVVVPGVIDEVAGVAVWSANLGFRDVALKALLEARLGLPAALGHDVRAGGLAEARLGAGRDHRYVLVIPIGTGIAAASIMDGRVYTGANGAAGEIGHIVVRPDGPLCGCGQRGCLETVASASAVARRYAALTGRDATAEEVAMLATAADSAASRVWQETIDALADGLMTGIALFDPAIVIIGGGLAEAGDALLEPLRKAVGERITFHREPLLTRAALGDEAGCLGAALLALDRLPRDGGIL